MIGVDKSWETYDIDDGHQPILGRDMVTSTRPTAGQIRAMYTGFQLILIPHRWKAGML